MEERISAIEDKGELKGVKCNVKYARKRGRDHIAKGTVCQDYSTAKNIGQLATVVAVADGHGGAAYEKSDRGSRIACEAVCKIIEEYIEENNVKDLCEWLKSSRFKAAYVKRWQNEVIADYKSIEPETQEPDGKIIKKYGTTILFAVITKRHIVAGQLGDGAVMLFTDNNYQLLKRHRVKTDSKTSSLASDRGIYSFVVEAYERRLFDSVLLTTDGMYDRLDGKGSLLIYADEFKKRGLDDPFTVTGIDVSSVTRDDCTVALIMLDKRTKGYRLRLPKKYSKVEFVRAYDELVIYTAENDHNERVEVHVTNAPEREMYTLDGCRVLSPKEDFYVADGTKAVIYPLSADAVRLQELIEYGDHVEKRYPSIVESEDNEVYTNEFWLDLCESMKKLRQEIAMKGYGITESFFKTAYVTQTGEIIAFCDALCEKGSRLDRSDKEFKQFFDNFAYLARLRCGDIEIPLFKCASHGQEIPLLHSHEDGSIGRILYNSKHGVYGLWNESGCVWRIEGEDRVIGDKKLLLLDKGCVFTVDFDGKKAIFGADVTATAARYEVIIL